MKIYIKNMVCSRCKMVVKAELEKQNLHPTSVELGEAEFVNELSSEQLQAISKVMIPLGFELIDDRKSKMIERIKNLIVAMVHHDGEQPKIKLSEYLSKELNYDYSHLTSLFSEVEGATIEQYVILHKVERAKELLVYDELSLSQIAFKIGYSNVAHLSAQFKKVTGLTPSSFKRLKINKRIPIEKL